jgi:predicted GNAT family acetyltransferase
VLTERDREQVLTLLAKDPVVSVMVATRVEQSGLDPWRLGGEIWAYSAGADAQDLCFSGANLVPLGGDDAAVRAFADKARRQGRRCSSIVGPAAQVLGMWDLLRSSWGAPRDIRDDQPLLVLERAPLVSGDPRVRLVEPYELDILLPAAVAMYTEEIGFSPEGSDGGALYRARVAELIAERRAFAIIEDGRVLFKAEVGAATRAVCQIQGVWVDPSIRGLGLGITGTAAVALAARRDIAPVVSLYVNAHNEPARRAYDRIGFTRVGTFASVLF